MIVFDGEKWIVPKYKITKAVVVYDDRPELYPDGVAEEVTLNADQKSRLEEIRYNTDMSMDQVEAYVIRGEGTPPDNRTDIDKLIDLIPEPTEEVMKIVDEWKPDARYQKGHYLKHNSTLYKVLQAHISQSDWTPDLAPSLFATLLTSLTGEVLEWVQPDSTNPYMKGDKVIFEGKIYESLIDNNIWSPTESPQSWYTEPVLEEWDPTKLYKIGDQVLFEGKTYESVIDNNSWSPADYAAGWKEIPVA